MSVASLEFSSGKAEIADVSKCVGDVSFQSSFYFNHTNNACSINSILNTFGGICSIIIVSYKSVLAYSGVILEINLVGPYYLLLIICSFLLDRFDKFLKYNVVNGKPYEEVYCSSPKFHTYAGGNIKI